MERDDFDKQSEQESGRLRKLLEDHLHRAESIRADLEQILAATGRISEITGQLLDFPHDPSEPPAVVNAVAAIDEKTAAAVSEALAAELSQEIAAQATLRDPWETGVQQCHERQTILLVDDEAGIRALAGKILRRERYSVLEAESAEEALAVSSNHSGRIDLLLTDLMLPGLTGFALAERMLLAFPELKVIFISGYTDDGTARRGAIPPDSRFLQKPFTLDALTGLVRAALAS